MAFDKAVDSTQLNADLTSVADTIRAKGGTSEQLAFPSGFNSAISAIETRLPLQIVVSTKAGASCTATKGSTTVSGTADTSGNCTLTVTDTGTWTVTATFGSSSESKDVNVGVQNVSLLSILPNFADNTWTAVIEAVQTGNVPSTWNVGDSLTMTIANKQYQIDIIGKNHDDYADGSGKAPLTFQMHDCYATKYYMCGAQDNSYGWERSMVREDTACPTIKKNMPAEVAAALKAVTKKTSAGGSSSSIVTTQDTLFCLSEIEVFGALTYSYAGEGTQYEYYKGKSADQIAKKRSGSIESWWLRSPKSYDTKNYCIVYWNGTSDYYTADTTCGVAVAFCF